ncbi:similar to hypothetical protein, N-terminal part [Listeria monocytogenes SLCC2376]|nr:similar to hypothetical protein, N-terminal part [Listeria monocytogenes SLCC2376]
MAIFGTPDEKETKKSERQKDEKPMYKKKMTKSELGKDGKTYKFPLDQLM